MQRSLKVLIVEDDRYAGSQLAHLCESRPDLTVVAKAESGASAIESIRLHRPNLVLLDLDLQDMSGFDMLRLLEGTEQPKAIIVGEYQEQAFKARQLSAIDFLVRPVDHRRFNEAIERAHMSYLGESEISQASMACEIQRALCELTERNRAPRILVAEKARKIHFVDPARIEHIESDGNYATLHTATERFLTRATLKSLEAAVGSLGFIRIERSVLLNIHQVAFLERMGRGRYAFTLRSGKLIASGPSYRQSIVCAIKRASRLSDTDLESEPGNEDAST